MTWAVLQFICGFVLAVATIRDVFDTVIAPGGSRASLRVARRLVFAMLPLWRLMDRKKGIPTSFAPFALLASFVVWMLLLTLGFGLMVYAVRGDLKPALSGFSDALYAAGNGLLTVGLSGQTASGPAQPILLAAGFCGLAVMTMAVTYLLEMQGGIAQRDAGILKLTTTVGDPPSGLGLLERYAALNFKDNMPEVMRNGRDWCAQVLQSHASHPTLIYFRSKKTGSGWPSALGALMDVALTVEFLLDAPEWRGLATLLREDGGRMAEALIELVGLRHEPTAPTDQDLDELISRLRRAGYAMRAEPDRNAFCAQRARHAACIHSMARHLGTEEAPLLPSSSK